jgi:hypothetical protein
MPVRPRSPPSADSRECTASEHCNADDELAAPVIGCAILGRRRERRLGRGLLRAWLVRDPLTLSLGTVCVSALLDVRLGHHSSFILLRGRQLQDMLRV